MMHSFSSPLVRAGMLIITILGGAYSQTAAVFATGLLNPSRAIVGPNSTLLVTEAGASPNSGRISLIDTGGNRKTILDGLPSGLAAPDMSVDGPNAVVLSGRTLYIGNGEGDSHRNGPTTGTIVPNPAGPSSPMFATILQVTLSNDVDKLTAGFALKLADHFTLMDNAPVTLSNGAGDTMTVSLLSSFRVDRPDPATIYRNTHLYGMTTLPSQPNVLFVVDAGNNAVWRVDMTTGKQQLLIRFQNLPDPIAPAGPPTSEPVPTSVRPYGSQLLVTLLTGAPFVPGASRIMQLDPVSGTASLFISSLSSTIDSLFRTTASGNAQWFALEYSLGSLSAPQLAPGRLMVYNSLPGQILVDGLNSPSGLALDGTTNNLYILDRTDGTILRINVGA